MLTCTYTRDKKWRDNDLYEMADDNILEEALALHHCLGYCDVLVYIPTISFVDFIFTFYIFIC